MKNAGRALFGFMLVLATVAPGWAQNNGKPKKNDVTSVEPTTQVIVRAKNWGSLKDLLPDVGKAGGKVKRQLDLIDSLVAQVPASALDGLRHNPHVQQLDIDRPVFGAMERTGATVGADIVRQQMGLDGRGIGVAVIDSGVTTWHDDLSDNGSGQRVDAFVDFVNDRSVAYDDYGHGTHVAGIIAGNGYDSSGRRTGIAPGAHLIVLKALDENGGGTISDIIAALDYVHTNRYALNIRVVNLSIGAGVYQSYLTDPLTLATRRIVEDGIVVVAAAGNAGKDPAGNIRYGGVTAPGNAPWVLTVGASSHMGTADRADDTMAAFSSRGPTAVNYTAKPDLVAPGVGIESLSGPKSTLYASKAQYLLDGTVPTSSKPYLSLTGTSMAAPVVAGTVALMLQADPALTPNAVKAILQYTSERYYGSDSLTQGAGFLNSAGAVQLARAFANPSIKVDAPRSWTRRLIWANHSIRGGTLDPSANAWSTDVTWGDSRTPAGELIGWGKWWGVSCANLSCSSLTWGSSTSPNVVWGTKCGGNDCVGEWRRSTVGSQPLSTDDSDTVVWGNSDTVVWGNDDADTVVWGNADEETVVWGNSCVDRSCEPVIWGTVH